MGAKTDQELIQETIDISTRGYIVHPNFIVLDLAGAVGADQNYVQSDGNTSDNYGTLYTWDASGTLLRNGEYPLTVFSKRQQEWSFPEFGPALQTTTTDTGASLEVRSAVLPSEFRISHLESSQTGLSGTEDFSYTRDAFDWFSTYRPTGNQTYRWDYSYSRVKQQGVIGDNYETHEALLSHDVFFGPRQTMELTSTADYKQQSGRTDLQHFRWDERLRIEHTDNFHTHYDYTFDYFSVQGTQTTRNRGDIGFTHQLYRSLTTNGDVSVQHSDTEGSGSLEAIGNLNLDYHKEVPLGALTAGTGVTYAWQRADASKVTTTVLDAPVTFTDPQPIVLAGTNIDPNSIVITDPSGLLLYRPGIDYTVRQFSDHVEIQRMLGGRIGDNTPVLLDYQLLPQPAATTTTLSYFASIRYDIQRSFLAGLGIYGRYSAATQDISSATPSAFVANNYTDIIFGGDYRIWQFTFGAEHEIQDSDINPFDAARFYARYTHRVDTNTTLNLNSAYTIIRYDNPKNRTDLFTASAQLVHNFGQNWNSTLTLLYRYEDDSLFGLLDGAEEQFELRWHHRQLSVYALVRNSQLNTVSETQSFQFFELGLRREF